MKKIFFVLQILALCKIGISQNLAPNFYKLGVSTFNEFIYHSFKENPQMKGTDTLCIESCTFIRFTIYNKKVLSIRFSKFTPGVIASTIEKALYQTDGFWLDMDTTVYLLPIVYLFETNNCRPLNRSSGSVLSMLTELSDTPEKQSFPGYGNEAPLKCIILNPFLLKYL